MKPAPTIRAATVLLYITGFGSLLLTGPSMAYNLITGNSVGSLLGMNPAFGDYLGPNPFGLPVAGAVLFGVAMVATGALSVLAAIWLGKSQKRGGRLGTLSALGMTVFGIGLVLPPWILAGPIVLGLIRLGWETLY
jgi:hypothetical protein